MIDKRWKGWEKINKKTKNVWIEIDCLVIMRKNSDRSRGVFRVFSHAFSLEQRNCKHMWFNNTSIHCGIELENPLIVRKYRGVNGLE